MTQESNKNSRSLCNDFWKQFVQYFEKTQLATRVLDEKMISGRLVFNKKKYRARRFFCIHKRGEILAKVLTGTAGRMDERDLCVEVLLEKSGDTDTNKKLFHNLKKEQDAIGRELGVSLEWEVGEDTKRSKIFTRKKCNPRDMDDWPNQHRWIEETIEKFDRVFTHRLEKISL